MRISRFLLALLLVAVTPLMALAQTTFTVKVPAIVSVGEAFRVEFTVNADIESFNAPSFDGFTVVAGPSRSTSSSYSNINGKATTTKTNTYTYVLISESEGNYQIGAATAVVGGKSYSTKVTPLEVAVGGSSSTARSGASSSRSSAASSGSSSQNSSQATSSKSNVKDLVIRAEVNHTDVYRGEPILVKLKLYTRASVSGVSAKPVAFNGFWNQEMPVNQNITLERGMLDGNVYDVALIKEYLLFPQKTGKLEIEPMSLTVTTRQVQQSQSSGSSLFDNFFGGPSYVNVNNELKSLPVTINVKELPSGAPASFSGAVGKFEMAASLKESQLSANSSGNIEILVSGSGNFPMMSTPGLDLPSSFELYPSKTKDNYKVSGGSVRGSKNFDYPFIARAEGEFTLPPIEFTFFDIEKKEYVTLSSEAFEVEVLRDVTGGDVGADVIGGLSKKELEILGSDIHFIKIGDAKLAPVSNFIIGSASYFATLFIIIVLFVTILVYLKKRIKQLRDTVRVKNKKANKVALSRLKEAKRNMNSGLENEFYSAMLMALTGYIGDKLNIEVARLSKEYIREQLEHKGVESVDIEQLLSTISNCEFAQYAPSASVRMSDIYNQSLELIGRLESKL